MNKKTRSQKQRKIDDLTREQRRNLYNIKKDIHKSLEAISYVEDKQKNPNKVRKSDLKKGRNSNLGVWGIHSANAFKTYKERLNTIATFCVRHYNIKSLAKIKPYMIKDFFSSLLKQYESKEKSAKTIKNYLNAVLKLQEAALFRNIISLQNLVTDEIKKSVAEIRYSKQDYKRGVSGGYSLEECKIIERKLGYLYGEEFRLMARVLWEAGPRLSELKRIKFEDIKPGGYTGYHIELFHPNQCKNNRPRRIPISEQTYRDLMALWEKKKENNEIQSGQNIWGKYSDDQIRSRIEKACKKKIYDENGKQIGRTIPYSGVHDFRKGCVAYWDQQFVHKQEEWPKERLVDAILFHVKFQYKDLHWKFIPEHKLHQYPLNPYVKKYEYRKENGKIIKTPRLDEKGKPVYGLKYTREELLKLDIRVLRNMLESQILGHNRTSVIGDSYRTWKNTNSIKVRKIKPPKRLRKVENT